jgi:hypothetical protein
MASTDCIYRRTTAGQSALESGAPLPPPLRRVLGLVEADIHSRMLRTLLRQHTDGAISEWAAQLVRLGLIESLPVLEEHDLDFTGSLPALRP